jgi:FKBP-type peptidyl-prolyl cis-trans isomerase FklB
MTKQSDANPVTDEQKVSYGLGWQFGRHLLTHDFEGMDLDMAFAGVRDCIDDVESPISDEAVEAAFKTIAARVEVAREKQAEQMAGKSDEFLAENAKRPEVTVTSSGLQYEVVEMGEGKRPAAIDSVITHYHGTFINGEVFDSSVSRGQPAEFPIQNVIKGWTEVLQLMPVGSKWRVFVPSHLGYGEKGSPPKIPGNCALIFEIELINIA